jgi:hypothetical protein
MEQKTVSWTNTLTLLFSSSTLICCALPALLVTIGAGAALAGFLSAFPQLIWFSTHKAALFALSGVMLTIAGILQYRQRYAACPIQPDAAQACRRARRVGVVIYAISLTVYLIGFSFAYVLPHAM